MDEDRFAEIERSSVTKYYGYYGYTLNHRFFLPPLKTIITVTSDPRLLKPFNAEAGHPLDTACPLPLTRMLLIFEYLLHNFYDPPMTLLEQVTWNLFTSYVMPSSTPGDEGAVFVRWPLSIKPTKRTERSVYRISHDLGMTAVL